MHLKTLCRGLSHFWKGVYRVRILVVSDTHGMWRRIVDAYEFESAEASVDMIIHAGDYIKDLKSVKELLQNEISESHDKEFDDENDNLDEMAVEIEGMGKEGLCVRRVNVTGEIPIFVGVKGNCDGDKYVEGIDFLKIIEFRDKKIIVTHGHKEGVKGGLYTLYCKGLEMEADVVIFGHTHFPVIESDEKLTLMNPGFLVIPKVGMPPTYGIIEYDETTEELKFFIKKL